MAPLIRAPSVFQTLETVMVMRMSEPRDLKMTLGNKPPFARISAVSYCAASYNGTCSATVDPGGPQWWLDASRYFPLPWERYRDRLKTHHRYRLGPKPWRPGSYTSSWWQPYTGIGRFSGLHGKYHGARYRLTVPG